MQSSALALLAQQVLLGHDAVLEDQVAGGRTADTHLLLLLTNGEAGEGALHDEGGDAVVAGLGVGHGEDDHGAGHSAVGDEALGAVEHVVVTLQHSGGLLAGSVGTGVGLGQTEGANLLAGQQVGQILHLLLLGAVLIDGGAAQRGVGRHDDAGGAADLGQLLNAHSVGQHIAAGSAVLLGEVDAHHTQLAHLLHGLHGEALLLVQLLGQGLDFGLGKLAVHLADHLLLSSQMKIHFPVLLKLFYLE